MTPSSTSLRPGDIPPILRRPRNTPVTVRPTVADGHLERIGARTGTIRTDRTSPATCAGGGVRPGPLAWCGADRRRRSVPGGRVPRPVSSASRRICAAPRFSPGSRSQDYRLATWHSGRLMRYRSRLSRSPCRARAVPLLIGGCSGSDSASPPKRRPPRRRPRRRPTVLLTGGEAVVASAGGDVPIDEATKQAVLDASQ